MSSFEWSAQAQRPEPSRVGWRWLKLPVLAGPLRGAWWLPTSGGKILRLALGTYEPEQSRLFQQHISPGDVVFDVGAAIGYYTLLAARLVGPEGQVVAFEPEPTNFGYLQQHVQANRLANVHLRRSAVGARVGEARFARGTGTGTAHLSAEGDIAVPICRLDDLITQRQAPPTQMKIDVEGAELEVLRGARTTLELHRPTLFLSTHGRQVHRACCEYLAELDYELSPIVGSEVATTSEILAVASQV